MRKIWMRAAAVLAAVMICFGITGGLAASMHTEADDPAIEMTAEMGYQGMIAFSKPMPLRVRIRNNGGTDLDGILAINGYQNTQQYNRYELKISVPSGTEQEFVLPFTVVSRQDVFTPEITVDGKVVEAVNLKPKKLLDSSILVGVLSTKPTRMSTMSITPENDTDYTSEYWQTIPLTAETFPEQAELLEAFGILVVDDIDPASLNKKQQDALKAWMKGRHVLICSGGGSNVAWFSEWTGLEMTGTVTSRQILAELERYIGSNPSGKRMDAEISLLTGAPSLVADAEGNGLVFRTETGNGRIYTTAFEIGASKLFVEKSLHYFWRKVLTNCDNSIYYGMLYSYDYNSPGVVYPENSIAVPVNSPMLPSVLIAVGAVVLCCALWFILKKAGKQTWMWLAAPGLAAAAAVVILLISGGSELNRPLAAYTEHMTQRADGTATRYIGISAAAPASGMHSYQLDGMPVSLAYGYGEDYYYDYIPEDQQAPEPTQMAMCRTIGDGEQRIALRSDAPWEMKRLGSETPSSEDGRVDATIWMQHDGLYGEIRNNTARSLKAGKVITSYGYVSVPALQPGKSTAFSLTEKADSTPGQNAAADTVPPDGTMTRKGSFSFYNVVNAALDIPQDSWDLTGPSALRRNMISSAQGLMTSDYYEFGESALFIYSAEMENSSPLNFRVDGKPVDNAAGLSLINVEMDYLPVGKTGIVYRMPGMDKAVRMLMDESGLPEGVAESGPATDWKGNYHALSENPVFRFALTDLQGIEINRLQIVEASYLSQIRCFLLNAKTGEWDATGVNTDVNNPADYLDADGMLYCRLESSGGFDADMNVPTPALLLEGRDPNAEN